MTFYIFWFLSFSALLFFLNFGKPSLICRTSLWTCTFVSFGRIPAYHSRNVRGSRSWWWVLNTLIWFGYPIRSLSMKKRPTSTKPRRKTNSSESCTQGKFCGALGTAFSTSLYLCASVQTLLCEKKKIRKYYYCWLLWWAERAIFHVVLLFCDAEWDAAGTLHAYLPNKGHTILTSAQPKYLLRTLYGFWGGRYCS